MTRALRQMMTPPMLVALLALVVALGGTAYAAGVLPGNSVGSAQLKPGAVKASDLGAGAVTSAKIKDGGIKAPDLGPSSVGSAAIDNGSVGPADLAAGVADGQPLLRSGQSMSGHYGANAAGSGVFALDAITFPSRLPGFVDQAHVVFTDTNDTAAHCPGVGRADRGYLCFYQHQLQSLTRYAQYSEPDANGDVQTGAGRYGITLLWKSIAATAYVDGTWTVTAP